MNITSKDTIELPIETNGSSPKGPASLMFVLMLQATRDYALSITSGMKTEPNIY